LTLHMSLTVPVLVSQYTYRSTMYGHNIKYAGVQHHTWR